LSFCLSFLFPSSGDGAAAFDREWDAALSQLRRKRPDIAKKTLQTPGSQVRRCIKLGRVGIGVA
jgi:hypothetical protein